MMKTSFFALVVVASSALAQRPSNTSICDYYSTVLLGTSNATTQNKLLTLLVNTAIIGNYAEAKKATVPGILAKNATFNDTKVNLLPYFDGSLKSTNIGGNRGVAVNFLDGGGAEPLMKNMPADSKTSHQFTLLTHLYSYFGLLLGCSDISQAGFPAYAGEMSMYEVHKYMALDSYEVQYFIQQVGLAAASFGVSTQDVQWVGNTLQGYFGNKCAPKSSVLGGGRKELQSICTADDCPKSPDAMCKSYAKALPPVKNVTETTSPADVTRNGTTKPSPIGTNGSSRIEISKFVASVLLVGSVMVVI